jgi:cytochrome c553
MGFAVVGLLILALVAVAALYAASEVMLRRTYDVPLSTFTVPTDPAAAAAGQRLATIRGCFQGCHGKALEGDAFFDDWKLARIVAPDLTRTVRDYSDAELERAIRHGVRRNGRSTLVMPSPMFYNLSDADLGAILAFIRSQPVTNGPATEVSAGPLGRLAILHGDFRPQAEQVAQMPPRMPAPDPSNKVAYGRYLALTACSECHGTALHGLAMFKSPSLIIVAGYSEPDFATLMRTGIALGGRKLDLMREVALGRFSHFTDAEVEALHSYLKTLVNESN